MPDVLDDLRRARGPLDEVPPSAFAAAAQRLHAEIDRESAAPAPGRRSRPRFVLGTAAALAVGVAGLVALSPSDTPGARAVLERAAAAVTAEQPRILVADVTVERLEGDAVVERYGRARVWSRQLPGTGEQELRLLRVDGPGRGDESTSAPLPSSDPSRLPFVSREYDAGANRLTVREGVRSAFLGPELFGARELLREARDGGRVTVGEERLGGRPAYRLSWSETVRHARGELTIATTLWVDAESYAPLLRTERSHGTSSSGEPVDQTSRATIEGFRVLPDTDANRTLLRMSPHPGARRVVEG